MDIDQLLGSLLDAPRAARRKKMGYRAFRHYVKEGRGPRSHEWLGKLVYLKDDLDRWDVADIKRVPGPKKR